MTMAATSKPKRRSRSGLATEPGYPEDILAGLRRAHATDSRAEKR